MDAKSTQITQDNPLRSHWSTLSYVRDYSISANTAAICSQKGRLLAYKPYSANNQRQSIQKSVCRSDISQTKADKSEESRAIPILDTFTSPTNTVASVLAVQQDAVRIAMQVSIPPMAESPARICSTSAGLLTIVPHERTLLQRSAKCAIGLMDIVPHHQFKYWLVTS